MESIACRPRRFADDDLPQSLAQLVFVNRGYGALPGPYVAYYQEMFREVYRVKDREDREFRFRPFVSRFLCLALNSTSWHCWKTVSKIDEFVSSQVDSGPPEYRFSKGRNKPASSPWGGKPGLMPA